LALGREAEKKQAKQSILIKGQSIKQTNKQTKTNKQTNKQTKFRNETGLFGITRVFQKEKKKKGR